MGNSESKTESSEKKDEVVAKGTTCSDLNEDCIESIIRYLPLADLSSLSLTCRRAFELNSQYFYRLYPNYRMELSNKLSGVTVECSESYLNCFSAGIRCIRLKSEYSNLNPMRLFTFLRLHCRPTLQELQFDTINLESREIHKYGEQIHGQLKTLPTISFENCTAYDIYDGFLQYCEQLKNLIVYADKSNREACNKWLEKTYPHLETLVFYKPACPPMAGIKETNRMLRLLVRNPQIQKIASDYQIVDAIARTNIRLEFLVLRIEHKEYFEAIKLNLFAICMRKRIGRLQLVFTNVYDDYSLMADDLIALGKHVTLELVLAIDENKIFELVLLTSALQQAPRFKVKSLHLVFRQPVPDTYFHELPESVPDVQEIHFKPFWDNVIANFRPSIGTFAARMKHLKTLVIHTIRPEMIPPDVVVEMNTWRKKLAGACRLTIYFPSDVIKRVNFIIPIGSCVNIKPISQLQRDIFTCDWRII